MTLYGLFRGIIHNMNIQSIYTVYNLKLYIYIHIKFKAEYPTRPAGTTVSRHRVSRCVLTSLKAVGGAVEGRRMKKGNRTPILLHIYIYTYIYTHPSQYLSPHFNPSTLLNPFLYLSLLDYSTSILVPTAIE